MGLFDFFRRRRERESAIPGGTPDSFMRQLKGDGKPIGQPVGQAVPQAGQSFNLTGPADLTSMLAMFQQAFQSGDFQVTRARTR
jgi:hypothetical protein